MPSFNVQNAKALTITEGDVKTIHNSDGRLLWGALNYDVTYEGDTFQLSYTGDNLFTDSSDVIDSEHCTYNYDDGVYTITNTDESDPSLTLGIYLPAGYYTINSDSSLSANTQFVNGDTVVTSISSNYSNYTFKLDGPCTGIKFNWTSTSDRIVLGLNTLQIISTAPTPSTPQPISVVKGHQTVTLTGGTVSADYPLDLSSNNYNYELYKVGTTTDYFYKDDGNWYVHKAVGKALLDGTSGIGQYNVTNNWFYVAYSAINVDAGENNGAMMSDYFTGTTSAYMSQNLTENGLCALSANNIFIRNTDYDHLLRTRHSNQHANH